MAIFNLNGRRAEQEPQDGQAAAGGTTQTMPEAAPQSSAPVGRGDSRSTRDINARVDMQARVLEQKCPAFRMSEEIRSPLFRYYVWAMEMPVEEAFLLNHKEELLALLSKSEAEKPERRVPENGTGRVYPAATRPNFAEMSDAELDAIAAKVQKGERVSFE